MKKFKYTTAALLLAGVLGATSQAQAASILVDGFDDEAAIGTIVNDTDPAAGSTDNAPGEGITSTTLSSADRTITAEAITVDGGNSSDIEVQSNHQGSSLLEINNSTFSNGLASLYYTFDAEDLTAQGGTALIMDVLAIDLGVEVEMIVNGTSTSGFTAFTGPGQFFRLFSDFSDPTQFANATDLRLNFKGVQAWDGAFDTLRIDIPDDQVPEPATLALMGLGLAGFAASRKKKQA